MTRLLCSCVALSFLASIAPTAQSTAVPTTLTAAERTDGFVPLFDGVSLAGWKVISLAQGQQPVGGWYVRDGVLSNDRDRGENWLATEANYTDFVLRLEYRVGPTTDSGIFFRAPDAGYPSFVGMEFEIKGTEPDPAPSVRSTSAVYGAVAPRLLAAKPAGEWNEVEIVVTGRHVGARWNGQLVHDFEIDDPAYANAQRGPLSSRAAVGHIGMQAHLTGSPVEFRNIRVKVLSPAK